MGIFSKEKTYNLEPMLTPEQQEAMKLLMNQTGDQYSGSFGNFTATPTESAAVNRIYSLLNSGTPSALSTAEQTLTKLADTSFDPSDPSSGYAAYQRQVARAQNESNDVVNRESAITGSRFGDRILNTKADLAMQGQDLLSTKLADLYNNAQNKSLSAAQGLTSVAGMGNDIELGRVKTASEIGGLQRMLDTAKAQAEYGDWQRAREERLGALQSVMNKNVEYGSKSMTKTQSTPWGQLLNAGLTAAGTALGGPIGGMIGNAAGGMIQNFSKKTPSQSEILGVDTRMYM